MRMRNLLSGSAFAGLAMFFLVGGASAGEAVYSDSFGNLVVHAPSGYKRIVVGKGYLADQVAAATPVSEPEIVYADEIGPDRAARRCFSRAETWRGRDRMYGLVDGQIPQPRIICE